MKKEKDRFFNHTSNNLYQPIPVRDEDTELDDKITELLEDKKNSNEYNLKLEQPLNISISLNIKNNKLLPTNYPIIEKKNENQLTLAYQLLEDIKLAINRKLAGKVLINKQMDCDITISLVCVRTTKESDNYNMNPISTSLISDVLRKTADAMIEFNREDTGEEQMEFNQSEVNCQLGTSDVSETTDESDENCQLGTSEPTEQPLDKEE